MYSVANLPGISIRINIACYFDKDIHVLPWRVYYSIIVLLGWGCFAVLYIQAHIYLLEVTVK